MSERDDLDQVGFLLGRVYYSYIGLLQRWLDEVGLSEYLKPGMGSLLFALFREDNRNLASVAAELHVAKSTMTGMVTRMRQAGLVVVEPDPTDARSLRLCLTPLANSLKPRCRKLAARMERLLLKDLPAAEAEVFRRSLVQVGRSISEELTVADEMASASRKPRASSRSSKQKGVSP